MSWMRNVDGRRSNAHNVVFSSAALRPEGGVYVPLGHFTLAEGAPVLLIDTSGKVVETIRLMLPRFPSLVEAENPLGFMSSGEIGVAGSQLFLASGDGKVAFYESKALTGPTENSFPVGM